MDQLGSDMLVDAGYDEKQDVAIISPEDNMEEADAEPKPRADDFDAMKKQMMPELPDLETEAEAVNTWEIKEWRNMSRREHGPVFKCADHPWRILFFPYGNNTDHASFYLEQGFEDKPPEDWYACVQFMLVLWNPNDPSIYVQHIANHRFTAEEGDWGFTRFAELRKLFQNPWEGCDRPLVENNSANITAYVRVIKDPTGVLWHNFLNYDSKKETGMVGLKNQGATCYLNSLLQSLYFTNAFRQAVYQIPTEEDPDRTTNSAYALQRLFYQLQTSNVAVSTNELTASFGWDTRQIFEQQDVQELSRVLMERLETKMKGTEAENALAKMFAGKMKTYISCINVPYESSRIEDFWDIQLNVSGNKNLDDSFRDYIQVETMDGDNKYFAEGYGLQDAKKGVIFETFPDVLHLQLKRFEYDFNRDAMMKVNDRYEFPEIWDASPYLSETADRSEPFVYRLHGILVHSGDLNAGHYYAFIKPTKDGHYYKFDDDRVTRATKKEALEENFGGEYTNLMNGNAQRNPYTRTWSTKRSMSAYMLVYIRESRLDQILLSDDEVQPPQHLAQKFAEERAAIERKKKEREEMHLYLQVSVATEKNFTSHQGFDIAPWTKDAETEAAPKTYKILKTTTIAELTAQIAEEMNCGPEFLRPWAMVNRQNGTIRPDGPIHFPEMSLEEAAGKFGSKSGIFKVWIETTEEKDEEGKPVFGDAHVDLHGIANNKPIMLFLKYFDPEKQTLFGIGTFYAACHDKVVDLCPQILKLLDLPAGTSLRLFEEIKSNMIEQMKPKVTLLSSEIQDGDIITVQKSLSEKEIAALTSAGRYSDVREFYDYLLNRINVQFCPKNAIPANPESTFTLWLSKKMSYDQVAAKVGEHLNVEPTHVRFSTVNMTTGRPKAPVKRMQNVTLNNILYPTSYNAYGNFNQRQDALYYEILEYSLSELDQMKAIKLSWLPEGIVKEEPYEILVAKNGTMEDLIKGLQKKAGLDDETTAKVRLFEVASCRFKQEVPRDKGALSIQEFTTLYAEKRPEEEESLDKSAGESLVSCYHFDKEPNKPHGIPFVFVVKPNEPFKDTKERLSKRTAIKGKQFEKIKFALVIGGPGYPKVEPLEDDDVLAEKLSAQQEDGVLLGFDHVNKARNAWGKSDSIFIK